LIITPGSILFVADGDAVHSRYGDDPGSTGPRSKKSVEKATKDVICDLAGQVRVTREWTQPAGKVTDRQNNITLKGPAPDGCGVLSGDVYNLPHMRIPVVEGTLSPQLVSVLAERPSGQ